jgi:hypothetical protein
MADRLTTERAGTGDAGLDAVAEASLWNSGTSAQSLTRWSRLISAREIGQHQIRLANEIHETAKDALRSSLGATLATTVREGLRKETSVLLDEIATKFGLAWVDLARMTGVSVPAIRKWRLSGGATPDNHERVAQVWAFLSALDDLVPEPVSWLTRRLEPGFTVTARHLWEPSTSAILLDLAAETVSTTVVLDELHHNWREQYATKDELVFLADGSVAIARRS